MSEASAISNKNLSVFTAEKYLTGELNLHLQHKILIEKALRKCNGNTVEAAKENGIKHRTFLNKLYQHSINPNDYKLNKN